MTVLFNSFRSGSLLPRRDFVDVAVHRGHVRVRNVLKRNDSEMDSLFVALFSQTDSLLVSRSQTDSQKAVKNLRSKLVRHIEQSLKNDETKMKWERVLDRLEAEGRGAGTKVPGDRYKELLKKLENTDIGGRDEIFLAAFADLERFIVKFYREAPRHQMIVPSVGSNGDIIGIVYRPGLVPGDEGDYNAVRELTQEVQCLVFRNFAPSI